MFMNAEVALKTKNALVVPEAAVVRWENKNYVFTDAGNGNFSLVEVELGLLQNGRQQIIPVGVLGGKDVVLQNAYALLMKMKNSAEE